MTLLRTEVRAILPAGHIRAQIEFEAAIIRAAGGFTRSTATGAWEHPETGEIIREPVHTYDIAVTDDSEVRRALIEAGAAMGEHTVYFRDSMGFVSLIEVSPAHVDAPSISL